MTPNPHPYPWRFEKVNDQYATIFDCYGRVVEFMDVDCAGRFVAMVNRRHYAAQ